MIRQHYYTLCIIILYTTHTPIDIHSYTRILHYTHVYYIIHTYTDQEIRQAIVDMSFMRNVLNNVHSPVFNDLSLPNIDTVAPRTGPSSVEFRYELGHYCIV